MAPRPAPITIFVWYPAAAQAMPALIRQNALFYVQPGAEALVLPAPVVVRSHGSGGDGRSLGWLGSALAARGMIVVAINHTGTTSGDSEPVETPMIGPRARYDGCAGLYRGRALWHHA